MPTTAPITKVKTPDGVIHDFSTTHYLNIPSDCIDKLVVPDWIRVNNFTGTVTLISGDNYKLTITS